jgi:membrane protein DedA with SNARE-associated domain
VMEALIKLLDSIIQGNEFVAYSVIFLLSILEGPKLTVVCGLLATKGLLNQFVVYALVVLGDMIGDTLWYSLGRFGGKFVERFGPKLGLTKEKFSTAQKYFESHEVKALALSKLIHGIGIVGLVFAGSSKCSYGRYIFICTLISLGQAFFFLMLGIFAGDAYIAIGHYMNSYAAGASSIVIVIAGLLGLKWILAKINLRLKEGNVL